MKNENLLLEEQKSCRLASMDQNMIDKAVIRNCKRRKINQNIAWLDFRKTYGMVPHAWIIKALKLIGAAPNLITLLKSTMIHWKIELISGDISLGAVNINRGIFQGNALTPLLFFILLIPLTLVLRQMSPLLNFTNL